MISQLTLDIPDTFNVATLRINDSSWYNESLTVECGLLEVTPPGYSKAVNFNVDKAFSIVLNSSNLKLAKAKVFRDLKALPDGVYKIKYSIKPNEALWIQYDYMRVNTLLKDYYTQLCQAKLQPYPSDRKVKDELKRLAEIRTYIDAAKVEVEECGNRKRGIELYNYAKELITSGVCFTCK